MLAHTMDLQYICPPNSLFSVVVLVVVLTLARIIKSVVTGQAPVTLEWRNTPREKTQTNKQWYSHLIYHTRRNLYPCQKNIRIEIGSQNVNKPVLRW